MTSAAVPTDAEFIRFEVRVGMRRIDCAVLDEALEAVSGLAAPSTPVLRRKSFDRFRTLINSAAKLKSDRLPAGFSGRIVLTTEDLRCVPPEPGALLFGSSPRGSGRQPAAADGAPATRER
jgi:hypothetical protein